MQGWRKTGKIMQPDIEKYPFAPFAPGQESCQLHFQFNEAAAPETMLRAHAVRLQAPGGEYSYKIGIVNPHIPARQAEDGATVLWFYSPDEMKLLLNLPADAPEAGDGYLGPFDAARFNTLLAMLRDISVSMHHSYEARKRGTPDAPRPV